MVGVPAHAGGGEVEDVTFYSVIERAQGGLMGVDKAEDARHLSLVLQVRVAAPSANLCGA